MPSIRVNGVSLNYEEIGSGDETIVFSHGLLMSLEMFRHQVESLKSRYRCIAYDHRGQGKSEVTQSGYNIENITEDARGLIEALDAGPCHFVGLSMGGFAGMRLGIRYPELIRSLTLIETSADPEARVFSYRLMALTGRWLGFGWVINPVMKIMFGESFMNDPTKSEERLAWKTHILNGNRKGFIRAANGVINRKGVYQELGKIAAPTLVVVGQEDTATTPEKARRIADSIPEARLVEIASAGHSSTIEQPEVLTHTLESFLTSID